MRAIISLGEEDAWDLEGGEEIISVVRVGHHHQFPNNSSGRLLRDARCQMLDARCVLLASVTSGHF